MDLAFIPSPSRGQIDLGPIPLRGYALCIIIGVVIAIWLGERRWVARGGRAGTVGDLAVWMVPFGLVGGRLYHVITTPEPYFGDGGDPAQAFAVWKGGLGIWGAIALGGVGAWIACRRRGIPLPAVADALAPGIVIAQAVGRWGNWFNQELYGRETDVPWAVEIDGDHNVIHPGEAGTFHPTFLYESLWCIGVAALVIWADRRFKLGHGRAFALYVAGYTVGRFWIEYMRVDDAEHILGMRLNNWTAIVVFVGAIAYIWISGRKHPGREAPETLVGTYPGDDEDDEAGDAAAEDVPDDDARADPAQDTPAEAAEADPDRQDTDPAPDKAASAEESDKAAAVDADTDTASGSAADSAREPSLVKKTAKKD
ncbi:prolipoprotein diacylglyceryl transferase [Streptomyces sp. SID3343]|uniref:prolipoprotein diacylglyceryl transferase n=1 Tax=Streptomyces sp. SID3343 TaxID=2690260 RepID=UPI00136C0F2A|nr:prolipoprotein diacylglyceryl transferase [Streptomyces sp. SID3343]MYW02750.1 prolipoprotein diacylglyceryl transferase [Streptomyces sp. SID3343]